MHAHGITPWTPKIRKPYAWFRSDLGVSLVSGAVAAWADQSGNGRNLTQGSAPSRLGFNASVAAFNNRPALVGTAAGWLDAIASWGLTQPFTIYVVGQAGTFADWRTFFDCTAGARSAVRAEPANLLATFAGTANVTSASVAAPSIIAAVFNGASSAHYVNSVTAGGLSTPGPDGIGTPRIGAGPSAVFPMRSDSFLFEIAVFVGADSTAQRAQMFRYERGLYRLAVAGL